MRHRHPVPRLWLMTDERMGNGLWRAVRRLPHGSGIVFRHYATSATERRWLFKALLRIARARGLVLVRAGHMRLPGEMGTHGQRGRGIITWPAHSRAEAVRGLRFGADAMFISPIFATRSHSGAATLGARRASAIARGLPALCIALGGVNARAYARLTGFDGWAAIDAWL